MLELTGVSKQFGQKQAVHPTDLSIAPKRTTVLIGPSGCGKSTLLRLMIGLIRPDTGHVRLDGETLDPAESITFRHRMGYVIQEGGLFPHLTARGNVTLLPRFLRWDAARCEARVTQLTELTQFPADGLDRFPAELSGGQRQRVGLMRALMLDPEVLLLDEPLGALDPMIRSALQGDLRGIFQTLEKTVVMVTHDLAEAAYFGDTIVLLREGRIVQQGTLQALVDSPAEAFVADFVSSQRSLLDALAGDMK